MNQTDKTRLFASLHEGPGVLVLPNAWDAASAAMMQDAGARAVATSSAAVAWAHGYADGHHLPTGVLLTAIGEIARVVGAPLTADIEGGYSDDPAEVGRLVGAVIEAGAVGINLEDGSQPSNLLERKVAAARDAAEARGGLFINARVDVYLRALAEGEAAFEETVRRARLYLAAGADGIFVPGPNDPALIGRLCGAIPAPLNVMARPGVPAAEALASLGVRRLSSATGMFRAAYATLGRTLAAFLETGDPAVLAEAGKGAPELNARFGPR